MVFERVLHVDLEVLVVSETDVEVLQKVQGVLEVLVVLYKVSEVLHKVPSGPLGSFCGN